MSKFSTIRLAEYTAAQILFIESVEHDYEADEFNHLESDYAEELDALAVWNTTKGLMVENGVAVMWNTTEAVAHTVQIEYNAKGLGHAAAKAAAHGYTLEFAGGDERGNLYYSMTKEGR